MSKNETLLMKGVIHMCVKNVGRMDAYVRISAGLMMVSLGIMKHKGWMAALGSMKVAEGITRYCPVLDALNLSTTLIINGFLSLSLISNDALSIHDKNSNLCTFSKQNI